jgi:hypothetical protein
MDTFTFYLDYATKYKDKLYRLESVVDDQEFLLLKKGKSISLKQAVEAHRVPARFPVLISVRGLVDPSG